MWVEKQIQEEKGVFKFRSVSGPSLFEAWVVYSLSFLRALPILGYSVISHPLGSVLPDVSYQVESSEGEDQSQDMGSQGQTVLLFLFVDFHREFPGQKMELWGVHTLLSTHLRAILRESHSVVQGCIQAAVDRALEQHHQAVKAHQKLQASLSVAVDSIMSIMTGSTNSTFRKTCLQTLQAADTQEFRTKLHKSFHEVTQHRFVYHCSQAVKQGPASKQKTRGLREAAKAWRRRGPSALLGP